MNRKGIWFAAVASGILIHAVLMFVPVRQTEGTSAVYPVVLTAVRKKISPSSFPITQETPSNRILKPDLPESGISGETVLAGPNSPSKNTGHVEASLSGSVDIESFSSNNAVRSVASNEVLVEPVITQEPTRLPSGPDRGHLLETFKADLRREMNESLHYPRQARRRNWEGTVLLVFKLQEHGEICDIKIKESSGFSILDNAALETLSQLSQRKNTFGEVLELEIPVEFVLE